MAQRNGEHGSTGNSEGKIVLLGATGFTGRLTAEAMVRAGLAPVLAGRNPERLQDLTRELTRIAPAGAAPTWEQADATIPESVIGLVSDPSDVLVSTAGPFSVVGAPAVSAAINAGCTYIDSTGEAGFIRQVFKQSEQAAATGARLIPACGYDFIPGNFAGALALRNCRDRGDIPASIDIGYFTRGPMSMSSGTQASAIASWAQPGTSSAMAYLRMPPLAPSSVNSPLSMEKKLGASALVAPSNSVFPPCRPHSLKSMCFWVGPVSGVSRFPRLLGLRRCSTKYRGHLHSRNA